MRRALCHFPKSLLTAALFLFFLHFAGNTAASAETLQKYREDINKIKGDLTHLYTFSPDDYNGGWTEKQQLQSEDVFFAELSFYMPPRETVQWEGAQIEVDNRWLHERVEALKKTPRNSYERDGITTEIHLRLSALEFKITELLSPAAGGGSRNKDEEKQTLAQILTRPEYQAPDKKEKSAIERWWEAFTKWLSDLFPRPEPIKPVESGAVPMIPPIIIQALVVAAAVAVIAFVIWWFAPAFRNRRRLKKEGKGSDERIILGERLAANESSSTLFEQAESMAREGNFRGAIRKGYIALLCELGDRKIIRLARHKTNRDYLRDVSRDQDLHRGVGELTSIFENHWYGLSSASEEDWGTFRERYRYNTGK